ncbi:MAG: FAD-dependent oxidoreductase, partial [Spirochaetales bacterium]|nr:FAD-dependent oxidoreductase [Spirochaetales bacterium]
SGLKYFPKLCNDLQIDYNNCKKLVIAKDDEEKKTLVRLYEQGLTNSCEGLSLIDRKQIESLQPSLYNDSKDHSGPEYALFSEKTAVVSPYEFTIALAENALLNGAVIKTSSEVNSITKISGNDGGMTEDLFQVGTKSGFSANGRFVVNAAGLYSDKVAALIDSVEPKIYPWRGEYYILEKKSTKLVNMAIYPVPPSDGAGLGVHLTPTVHDNLLIGPSAEFTDFPENLENTTPTMKQLMKEAWEMVPDLRAYTAIKNFSGMRAKLFGPESSSGFEDYYIKESANIPNLIHLIGIESPGLTAAPAIAHHIIENFIGKIMDLKPNPLFSWKRQGPVRIRDLDNSNFRSLTEKDPAYGEIICFCSRVSKGEIREALHSPLSSEVFSSDKRGIGILNAIKKRTHSLMGDCQGGRCLSRILQVVEEELGISAEEVLR